MDKKEIIASHLEILINESKKDEFQAMYGVNSKFIVTNVGHTSRGQTLYIEGKIILGDIINETILDSEMINILILDHIKFIYDNNSDINLSISFDV